MVTTALVDYRPMVDNIDPLAALHKSSERTKRLDSAIQVQTANLVSKGINLHAEQTVSKY